MRILLLPFVFAVLSAGCCSHCCRRDGPSELSSAPESVVVDGRPLWLEADLWRDFQPMAPPGGQGLKAAVRVVTDPDLPLPSGVAIERLWLFYSKEQWRPALPDRAEPLVVQLADGPKWGPGVDADVVVRLKRGKDTWLLRAAGRPIKRTD